MPGRVSSAAANQRLASLTRATSLSLTAIIQGNTDLNASCVVWGSRASAPTTFGDLTHPHQQPLEMCSVNYNGTSGNLDISIPILDIHDLAVGDHLWAGYVGTINPAISGTVIDAVVDCGLVVA
jgi:hypothetical protein